VSLILSCIIFYFKKVNSTIAVGCVCAARVGFRGKKKKAGGSQRPCDRSGKFHAICTETSACDLAFNARPGVPQGLRTIQHAFVSVHLSPFALFHKRLLCVG